jgi:single-strand DNA-binding protein
MACLKMPEVNHVLIAGNLTKDPVIRKTGNGIPVINFCLASNHRYRDASNQWAEDVCYVGVVAWSKLADSCMAKLRKGSAVLVDGELQSRTWHAEDGSARTVVEIKAHRIQFLNKQEHPEMNDVLPEGVDVTEERSSVFEQSVGEYEFAEAQTERISDHAFAAGFDEGSAKEVLFFTERPAAMPMELKLRPKGEVAV